MVPAKNRGTRPSDAKWSLLEILLRTSSPGRHSRTNIHRDVHGGDEKHKTLCGNMAADALNTK
eukprot:6197303-Pyramimonas_sp.AAC.1